jgi:type VI secretion system protein ImpC
MSKEGSVAPKDRVNIAYKPAIGNAEGEIELPLKVLMVGDPISTWKEPPDLEKELNEWIGQYVASQGRVSAAVRGRRTRRKARIVVTEVEGNAGWYKFDMQVRAPFKYTGASFTLSLVGKLDKA